MTAQKVKGTACRLFPQKAYILIVAFQNPIASALHRLFSISGSPCHSPFFYLIRLGRRFLDF
jgi:hypothetical protein